MITSSGDMTDRLVMDIVVGAGGGYDYRCRGNMWQWRRGGMSWEWADMVESVWVRWAFIRGQGVVLLVGVKGDRHRMMGGGWRMMGQWRNVRHERIQSY